MKLFRRTRTQSGVALVETAIVVPVVLIIVLCAFEFGLVFRNVQTLHTASRAGARTGAVLGKELTTDREIIKQVMRATDSFPEDSVQSILIFKAQPNGRPIPACASRTSFGGTPGQCTFYDDFAIDDAMLPASTPSANWGCGTVDPLTGQLTLDQFKFDYRYCAARYRSNNPSPTAGSPDGVERLGVRVTMKHNYITGLLPVAPPTLKSTTIMNLDPSA